MRAQEFIAESNNTAVMAKLADSGKIVRILKKAHSVQFSDKKDWLLIDTDPAKGNRGLGAKWIPANTKFEWVRPYLEKIDESVNAKKPSGIRTDAGKAMWNKWEKAGDAKYLSKGVAEGSENNRISFQVQKGKNKFATTLSIGNNPVGVYQYDANTGCSIAEVYPEFKGKGLGKLLVLHAIYTAAKLGLDFQEDESRTSEYDNVLDSLSSNGYIVDDDGYWYVTGEGEQFLKQSLKQGVAENFADGKGPGRPGDSVRHGIPKHATMAELEKASHAKGRKGQLARWQLNMRRGHKK